MGRPKGSINKAKPQVVHPLQVEKFIPPVTLTVSQPIRYDVIFGIRNLRSGPFKGLWELVRLDESGKRNVITDANSRGSIISMITKQILKIVIQS